MITLYGSNFSSPSNKVRFALNELGIEYDYKPVDLGKGEQRSPEFLKVTPVGRVPVIKDGDFVLSESNAIIKYLATKQKSSLYSDQLEERAIIDQWVDFASLHVGTAMARVFFNRILAPVLKMEVDERSLKDGLSFLDKFLPIVEDQLTKSSFLASSRMTIADINLLALLDPADICDIDLSKYSKLTSWRDALKKKSFYTKCYTDFGTMFNDSKR